MQNSRQILRVILKSLTFLGVLALSFVFVNSLFIKESNNSTSKVVPATETVSLSVEDMQAGQIKKIRWNKLEIAVLKRQYSDELTSLKVQTNDKTLHHSIDARMRSLKKAYFVYINRGDSNNCPLFYRAGIFTDTCTSSTYDESGRAKTNTSKNLEVPPHFFHGSDLHIGKWFE